MMNAQFAMLPFAAFQWVIAWSLRYVPIPIKNPVIRMVIILMTQMALLGSLVAQIKTYHAMTGINALANNRFIFTVIAPQCLIGLGILFHGAYTRRKKIRNNHGTN
jgi:hypothetical protein